MLLSFPPALELLLRCCCVGRYISWVIAVSEGAHAAPDWVDEWPESHESFGRDQGRHLRDRATFSMMGGYLNSFISKKWFSINVL
eukprot:9503147-Pyramimonas_sp.AAC.1